MNETNLNGRTLVPLFDFEFIVNSEIGLIRYIRENFRDDKAFDLSILDKGDREILSLLYARKEYNPLSIILINDNIDADELYNSFMTHYKKEILDLSLSEKKIMNFVSTVLSNGLTMGISPYVGVDDDIEAESIHKHFSKAILVYKNTKNAFTNKDPFYVKDFKFFEKYNIQDTAGKNIYMSPRTYNLDYFENERNSLTRSNVVNFVGINFAKRRAE